MFTTICILSFFFTVDDGGDEEETNMRNGGDRSESDSVLNNLFASQSNFQTAANASRVQQFFTILD